MLESEQDLQSALEVLHASDAGKCGFKLPFETVATARVAAPDGSPVSYTHLRAHETVLDLVCRLLLETKHTHTTHNTHTTHTHTTTKTYVHTTPS